MWGSINYSWNILRGGVMEQKEFYKYEACFRIQNELGDHYVTMFHTRYFEVIGNIYQNPELLEDK